MMSDEEAIKRAENELAQAIYNSETLNNPGLAKAYANKASYLSTLIYLAKKGLQAEKEGGEQE